MMNLAQAKLIADTFDSFFPEDGIRIPDTQILDQRSGKITGKHGFTPDISYIFGHDSNIGHYLEFYASEGLVQDLHVRIFEDGGFEYMELPSDATENFMPIQRREEYADFHTDRLRVFLNLKRRGLF